MWTVGLERPGLSAASELYWSDPQEVHLKVPMCEDVGGVGTQIELLVLQGTFFQENVITFGSGIETYGWKLDKACALPLAQTPPVFPQQPWGRRMWGMEEGWPFFQEYRT